MGPRPFSHVPRSVSAPFACQAPTQPPTDITSCRDTETQNLCWHPRRPDRAPAASVGPTGLLHHLHAQVHCVNLFGRPSGVCRGGSPSRGALTYGFPWGPARCCSVRHRGGARRLAVARGEDVRPRTPKKAAWCTAILIHTASRASAQPPAGVRHERAAAKLTARIKSGGDPLLPLAKDPRARRPRMGAATTRGAAFNSSSSGAPQAQTLAVARAMPCLAVHRCWGGVHALQNQAPPLHGVPVLYCTVQ